MEQDDQHHELAIVARGLDWWPVQQLSELDQHLMCKVGRVNRWVGTII